MRGTHVRFGAGAALGLALAVATAGALGVGCSPELDLDLAPELEIGRGAPVDGVEIATWNVAWLHGEDGKGTIARREADYARLRAYAARLDADIVALQEVAGEDAAARVLDPAVYGLALSRERDTQRTGFAYKRTLAVTRYPDVVALDIGGLRQGVDIGVRMGEQELRLLAVHLKSGCFDGALGRGGAACDKLRRQLPALEAWIDAREREGVPFAVLGDFNRRLRRDDEVWRELDDHAPVSAALTLVTDGRRSRCWNGKYPDFIDHIVLDSQAAAWLVPGSFEQLLYDEADARHRQRISDHCPISVRLEVAGTARAAPGRTVVSGAPSGPAAAAPDGQAPAVSRGQSSGRGSARVPESSPGKAPGKAGKAPAGGSGTGMVKGNISRGRKLYHLPGCPSYAEVRIDPAHGERLFTNEREAQAAGFQKAGNCP